jgi:outer membrane protein
MNKIKLFVAVVAFLTVGAGSASAQKTGYISLDNLVALMPEVGKIDTLLKKYQADSINGEFASIIQEYNYKDSLLNKTDTTKMPVALRKQYRTDLEGIAYQVQNWQAISQNAMQGKQNELLEPVYRKAMAALNQVAKEKGYTFVYNQEVLLVAPPADDLLPMVAQKLNIKLPPKQGTAAAPITPKK